MSHQHFHFSPLQKAAPLSIAGAVFLVLIFIIFGIEKEIQICYSKATKGNQEAAYPE